MRVARNFRILGWTPWNWEGQSIMNWLWNLSEKTLSLRFCQFLGRLLVQCLIAFELDLLPLLLEQAHLLSSQVQSLWRIWLLGQKLCLKMGLLWTWKKPKRDAEPRVVTMWGANETGRCFGDCQRRCDSEVQLQVWCESVGAAIDYSQLIL